jgi:threonine/homoserine/homoserine lactone efflux protein
MNTRTIVAFTLLTLTLSIALAAVNDAVLRTSLRALPHTGDAANGTLGLLLVAASLWAMNWLARRRRV